MANESGEGDADEVPDAVMEWLSSVAADRGLSERELLQSLLAGVEPDSGRGPPRDRALERLEEEFNELVQDVRERVVQVKRETDEKAPADHSHHDLRNSIEQLGREVGALEAQLEQLDERLEAGFENYEEVLTYLTDTTDELNRRLGQLASVVADLRERVSDTARDEVRRTALAHLTDTANRHGVDTARCEACGDLVDVSLLIEPRCPHCESSFTTIEPKSGFFRTSVLHTGSLPALESAQEPTETEDALASLADEAAGVAEEAAPDVAAPGPGSRDASREREADAEATGVSTAEPAPAGSPKADGDLQSLDGVGPAYAERLEDAGIDGLHALAVADPEELGEAIDVPASTVADWVEQADARTGAS